MNILSEIIRHKIAEVEERKSLYPTKLLEKSIYFSTQPVSLRKYLQREDKSGIIAEFKTKSPSKGDMNPYADVEKISVGYMQAGASALSILTDQKYFGGNAQDLTKARKYNYCPILQKDFFVDEYQILEAKSIGADAILLIASALSKTKIKNMAKFARSLGLEVLFEIHNKEELDKLNDHIEIVGVNNRDLQTFETNINQSIEMAAIIPDSLLKVSESGIKDAESLIKLRSYGYQGFLIGENFMRTASPARACKEFISDIKECESQLNVKVLKSCK